MAGLLIHRRTDNQHFLEVNAEGFMKSSSSVENSEMDDNNGNQKIKGRQGTRARPPVAYASIAPFPFLPAPSYDVVWHLSWVQILHDYIFLIMFCLVDLIYSL